MKKKGTILLWGFVITLALINLMLLVNIKNKTTENSNNKSHLEFCIDLNNKLLVDAAYQYASEGKKLDENIILENEHEAKISLNQIIDHKPKLVFRYSEINCQSCIDVQINNLKQLSHEIGVDNIIIVASYKTKRDLHIFKRLNEIKFPIYRIDEKGLVLELDNLSVPYYFIVDQDFQSNLIFLPTKEFPRLTQSYYSLIKKRFFEN